jgi:Tfp pilus assembly protein PilO
MPRNFEWLSSLFTGAQRGPRFWLQLAGIVLALCNGIALYFYLDPPGGSRADLIAEGQHVRNEIAATRGRATRLRDVAEKVQLGSKESSDFEIKYFLPKREAYEAVIAEIQRMTQESGLRERDAVYSEEPIEGTADLTILTNTANYEGTYDNLVRFLHQVDQSPMLLMLDNLQAAPQQKGGQINTSIRFQTIVQEEPVAVAETLR